MGCCASRNTFGGSTKTEQVQSFLESSNLNQFTFPELQRLETQIISPKLSASTFDLFSKSWNLKIHFSFFAISGSIHKFDLISSLLLFSKESYDKKLEIFNHLVNSNSKIMRFLEWRYQLQHERIPIEISRQINSDIAETIQKSSKLRLQSSNELSLLYNTLQSDRNSLHTLNILYI